MPETRTPRDQSPRNLRADLLVTLLFLSLLTALSLWFEARKNRNDFYPQKWLILAPFDLEVSEQVARDSDQLATAGGEGNFLASPLMVHKLPGERSLTWTPYTAPKGEIPFVILRNIIGTKTTNAIAYAQTTLSMPKKTELQLGIAADDGVKIWINGKVVFNQGPSDSYKVDQNLITVELQQGENQILVKNTQVDGGWGFALHFFDK